MLSQEKKAGTFTYQASFCFLGFFCFFFQQGQVDQLSNHYISLQFSVSQCLDQMIPYAPLISWGNFSLSQYLGIQWAALARYLNSLNLTTSFKMERLSYIHSFLSLLIVESFLSLNTCLCKTLYVKMVHAVLLRLKKWLLKILALVMKQMSLNLSDVTKQFIFYSHKVSLYLRVDFEGLCLSLDDYSADRVSGTFNTGTPRQPQVLTQLEDGKRKRGLPMGDCLQSRPESRSVSSVTPNFKGDWKM